MLLYGEKRPACLGISGAICTYPIATIDVIRDMLSLNIFVKREALLMALRLIGTDNYKPEDMVGQLGYSAWNTGA